MQNKVILLLIIVFALSIRIWNAGFPFFTSDEAAVALRGYTLSTLGTDEFGRKVPFLFNSAEDYQLPMVSYVVALGELIGGKNDLAVRFPFMLIGIALIPLTFLIATKLSSKKIYWYSSAFMVGLSPGLVFISKIPNEFIILTFLIMLLFHLLIQKKLMIPVIFSVIALSLITTKDAWFVLIPYTFVTLYGIRPLFYENNDIDIKKKNRVFIGIVSFVIVCVALYLFLVPQAKRSIWENNFTLFNSEAIQNGIERLRGQGIKSGWPSILEKVLFNKSHYVFSGVMNWLSILSLNNIFGSFQSKGLYSFVSLGLLPKIMIIPFLIGLFFSIKEKIKKEYFIILMIPLLTFPAIFIFPVQHAQLLLVAFPFIIFIAAFGLTKIPQRIAIFIMVIMLLEVLVGISQIDQEIKNTASLRPGWVKNIAQDLYHMRDANKLWVSDQINPHISSFVFWYAPFDPKLQFTPLDYPYKFIPSKNGKYTVYTRERNLVFCEEYSNDRIFLSPAEAKSFETNLNHRNDKLYYDINGNVMAVASNVGDRACIK